MVIFMGEHVVLSGRERERERGLVINVNGTKIKYIGTKAIKSFVYT